MSAGASPLLRSGSSAALGGAAVLGALALSADLGLTWRAWPGSAGLQPQTMEWLRSRTPADARLQSLRPASLRLLTKRDASPPDLRADTRDAWLAAALAQGVTYVHTETASSIGGFVPSGIETIAPRLGAWARSSLYAEQAFESDGEGTAVFRLSHPRPESYLKAWAELQGAGEALAAGRSDDARSRLERAVKLEPELATAWAALAGLEPKRSAKLADLEKAAMSDPSSPEIASALAALRRAPRK
jgi:hypothetical protein